MPSFMNLLLRSHHVTLTSSNRSEPTITFDHVSSSIAFLYQNHLNISRYQSEIETISPNQEPPLQMILLLKTPLSSLNWRHRKSKLLSPETPLYQSRSLKPRQVPEFSQQ
jgi:hypothetical protein